MKAFLAALTLLALALTAGIAIASDDLDGSLWRVTLETGRLGPVELFLRLRAQDGSLRASSLSGALDEIRMLPGAQVEGVELSEALFAFEVEPSAEGYVGAQIAPWRGAAVTMRLEDGQISGTIEGGLLGGAFQGYRVDAAAPLRDYAALMAAFDTVVGGKVFRPADLENPAYLAFRERMGQIASAATNDLDLLLGFRFAWTNQPFSHFELRRDGQSAEAMIAGFEDFRVGYEAARLEVEEGVAVLTVDTMMGSDTIEQIRAAYEEIARLRPQALLIDLRGNGGGAFAVKPLVEHVIDEPLDAGYFVSQKWNVETDRPPTPTELAAVEPWTGWSIRAFWRAVQDEGVLRIRFEPAEPNFDGPVYVLVDGDSASATELAADAFKASGVATLVGERTPGQMLSQSFFDVADGFLVSLPVADYYSTAHGRIEGVGVEVDREVSAAEALTVARSMAVETVRP